MSVPAEVLELGRGGPRSPRRRRVLVVVALVLGVALVTAGLVTAWERTHTFTADQARAALVALAPDAADQVATEDLTEPGVTVRPAVCAALLSPGAYGALDATTWSSEEDLTLLLLRFADPPAAREAHATLRRTLAACPRVSLFDDAGSRGPVLDLTRGDEGSAGSLGLRTTWGLRWSDAASADDVDLAFAARSYGNTLLVAISRQEVPDRARRQLLDQVTQRLGQAARAR